MLRSDLQVGCWAMLERTELLVASWMNWSPTKSRGWGALNWEMQKRKEALLPGWDYFNPGGLFCTLGSQLNSAVQKGRKGVVPEPKLMAPVFVSCFMDLERHFLQYVSSDVLTSC